MTYDNKEIWNYDSNLEEISGLPEEHQISILSLIAGAKIMVWIDPLDSFIESLKREKYNGDKSNLTWNTSKKASEILNKK